MVNPALISVLCGLVEHSKKNAACGCYAKITAPLAAGVAPGHHWAITSAAWYCCRFQIASKSSADGSATLTGCISTNNGAHHAAFTDNITTLWPAAGHAHECAGNGAGPSLAL
jgi:hypothetical protein